MTVSRRFFLLFLAFVLAATTFTIYSGSVFAVTAAAGVDASVDAEAGYDIGADADVDASADAATAALASAGAAAGVEPAAGEYAFTSAIVLDGDSLTDGHIRSKLSNGKSEPVSGFFIFAIYGNDRRLVRSEALDFTAAPGETASADFTIPTADYPSGAYTYRTFCWDYRGLPLTERGSVGFEFGLVSGGNAVDIYVDEGDFKGIGHAAENLQSDIASITDVTPALKDDAAQLNKTAIIAGSIGNNPVIDALIADGRLDVSEVEGKWEVYTIAAVANPVPGVDKGLVIAGSDKRGAIYGIYSVSDAIGASAWTFFGDSVPEHQDSLAIPADTVVTKEPSVKYRGIFINDEQQTMEWLQFLLEDPDNKMENQLAVPGFNHNYYTKLFDVILRLKGNYLWPAMWNNAFFSDDPLNGEIADEWGVVIGMTHHEFMSRSDKEWNWMTAAEYGRSLTWAFYDAIADADPAVDRVNTGFNTQEIIKSYWKSGVKERANYEQVVNLGLRGQEDTAALPGSATMQDQIDLLTNVINTQYGILEEVDEELTDAGTPHRDNQKSVVLYNEVDRFYYAGWDAEVPDDVITILAGDQHGQVRTLPVDSDRGENARSGGFGMYYHIDFNGGPKSNRYVSTMTLEKMQEQMTMAYDYGVQTLWVVNVGNLKFYETPVEYWFNLAYDIDTWREADAPARMYEQFAAREFGAENANDIADIIFDYTQFNTLHAPEWIMPHTYNVYNFDEGQRMLARAEAWMAKADAVKANIRPEQQDAYYEMVWYPAWGTYNIVKMMVSTALNQKYAALELPVANTYAADARTALEADNEAMRYWHTINGEKWKGFFPIDPPRNTTVIPNNIRTENNIYHIGMTSWNHPMTQFAFSAQATNTTNLKSVSTGEGSELIVIPQWLTGKPATGHSAAVGQTVDLPAFTSVGNETRYFEVGNKKTTNFTFEAAASDPWIILDRTSGEVDGLAKVNVTVDWTKIPTGVSQANGVINVTGAGGAAALNVTAKVESAAVLNAIPANGKTFIETEGGYVSILSKDYSRSVAAQSGAQWTRLANTGREGSAMKVLPSQINDTASVPGVDSPYLEYKVYIKTPGKIDIVTQWSPTNGTNPYYYTRMRYGVSFGTAASGSDTVQTVQTMSPVYMAQNTNGATFHNGVVTATHTVSANDFSVCYSLHEVDEPGVYTLRIYLVDDGLVLQKILVGTEALTDRVNSVPAVGWTPAVGEHSGVLRCDPETRLIFDTIDGTVWDNPNTPDVETAPVKEVSNYRVPGASSVPRIFIAPNSSTQSVNANVVSHLGPPETPFVSSAPSDAEQLD
jgi:hypothetical protein